MEPMFLAHGILNCYVPEVVWTHDLNDEHFAGAKSGMPNI